MLFGVEEVRLESVGVPTVGNFSSRCSFLSRYCFRRLSTTVNLTDLRDVVVVRSVGILTDWYVADSHSGLQLLMPR